MVTKLEIMEYWAPEEMRPGNIFILENAGTEGDPEDPYWAVLACPECGENGMVTRKQFRGFIPVLCGSDECSAQFFLRDEENIIPRKPS